MIGLNWVLSSPLVIDVFVATVIYGEAKAPILTFAKESYQLRYLR